MEAAADVFGAPAGDLDRVAIALRSVASRHGIDLAEVSSLDAAAAALGAAVWCAATGTTRFSEVPLTGPSAVEALSRVLMRAAGRPVPASPTTTHPGVVPDRVVAAADRMLELAAERGLDPDEVAALAAADLAVGGAQLAAAADALN